MYVSEATQFLRELMRTRPHLEADQQKGRAIWWDKEPLTLEDRARLKSSTVPQEGYVYHVKG